MTKAQMEILDGYVNERDNWARDYEIVAIHYDYHSPTSLLGIHTRQRVDGKLVEYRDYFDPEGTTDRTVAIELKG